MNNKIKYCVANWKMNFNSTESRKYLDLISKKKFQNQNVKVIIASSFIDIAVNSKYLSNDIDFAAQNIFYKNVIIIFSFHERSLSKPIKIALSLALFRARLMSS